MDQPRNTVNRRTFLRAATSVTAFGGAYVALGNGRSLFADSLIARIPSAPDGSVSPFFMLVLGDSIMWGQGLREQDKFSTKIGMFVENELGRPVNRYVFAHSGAHIKADAAGDARPPLHGEVPNDFPSITHQVALATAKLGSGTLPIRRALLGAPPMSSPATTVGRIDRDEVGLILLDGGINDVNVTTILSTDPTILDRPAWVRKITRQRVGPRMSQLLPLVLSTFPNAKVVVTSYFPIVSAKTTVPELEELLEAYGLAGISTLVNQSLRDLLRKQSEIFNDESVTGLRAAVSAANRATAAAMPVSTRITLPAGARVPPPPGRVAFAHVPFGPEHSYGAPDSYLWKVAERDGAYGDRQTGCDQAGLGAIEREFCRHAAMGHPNVAGANAYFTAIATVMQRWLPEWKGQSAAVASTADSGATRPAVPARIRPRPSGVRVP